MNSSDKIDPVSLKIDIRGITKETYEENLPIGDVNSPSGQSKQVIYS